MQGSLQRHLRTPAGLVGDLIFLSGDRKERCFSARGVSMEEPMKLSFQLRTLQSWQHLPWHCMAAVSLATRISTPPRPGPQNDMLPHIALRYTL